ncbi:MAG: hypothetical protein ABSG76_11250 [Xanthobacteraceae bacterium]
MDEGHALDQLLVGVDHGALRDSDRGVLAQALDDEREAEARRAADLAAHREDGECRHRNSMVGQQLLGHVLAAGQHEAARVAPRIGNAQQLEIAGDVLVIGGLAVKLLEQVEDDVRLPAFDLVADRLELVLHAERTDVVPAATQRADDIVLGLPGVDVLLAVTFERIRGHQRRMHQHQDAQTLHSANHCRRDGL